DYYCSSYAGINTLF
nr:immunoglobulin light chain junction region [Macaca mulatta]MOX82007.1 immunoglobulin light chain junction region [Macaca mulatta]MOX82456.1 immunoglobulin light chain junction region [Macaca mulatta]MOX82962.1 immunoglobulin light chain junction region [Macaca mulatta]MOX83141.1 immunoglobulin light chain junction region [Macaca mulatta]